MVLEEKAKHLVLFLFLLAALGAALVLFRLGENSYCLGIPVISESKAAEYVQSSQMDLSGLTLDGESAPVDFGNHALYLSQNNSSLDSYTQLAGTLGTKEETQSLYFVRNDALDNPRASMESGTPLTLLVVEGDSCCRVDVFLTSIPVLSIQGSETDVPAKHGYEMEGDCVLFAGFDPGTESYQVQASNLEWHVRGETTAKYDKKSYKISLKNKDGEKSNCNFLGMGSDDDWILNPMVLDDTMVREKTVMDLWNAFAETCPWDYKMSCGEYVEVVLNGEYVGLYLLQRRVDAKYLEIDDDQDVLLKGQSSGTLLGGYEIVSSPFNEENTYQLMVDAWEEVGGNKFHQQNFVDVSLLINYIVGWDNIGFKNMYYYLKYDPDREGYDLYFIPWDTDMSFGFYWDDGFAYNYQDQLASDLHRVEYYTVQLYSEQTDQALADRWNELRQTLYTEENITTLLEYNWGLILESGALNRDEAKWGKFHNNIDTYENLYRFSLERLAVLDELYS